MTQLRNQILKKFGLSIEWVITQGELVATIESALLKLLQDRFPGVISSAIVSSLHVYPVSVWLEATPGAKVLPSIAAVSEVCKELLKVFGVKSLSVVYADSEELPSNPMILRCLKKHAPITGDHLAKKLKLEGLTIPDPRWLHKKLDTMRRNGLLVWLKGEKYSLTELALSVVPYGKTRNSSDVERALALGRRKW
jgi:hypothetical protein